MEAFVTRPGEGERHERADGYRLIRADLEQLCVVEIAFDESFSIPSHVHDDHVDSFLVLDGEVEFELGDESLVLGPGSFVAVPVGMRHGFASAGGRARVLNVHAPGAGFADLVRGSE